MKIKKLNHIFFGKRWFDDNSQGVVDEYNQKLGMNLKISFRPFELEYTYKRFSVENLVETNESSCECNRFKNQTQSMV